MGILEVFEMIYHGLEQKSDTSWKDRNRKELDVS
jgi:hypothetical protein